MRKIGHHCSPAILLPNQEPRWLNNNLSLADATAMLYPYNSSLMNAYPVSAEIKDPKNDSKQLVAPLGQRINSEFDHLNNMTLKQLGFGRREKKQPESTMTLGEKAKMGKRQV